VLTESTREISNMQTKLHVKYTVHSKNTGDGEKLCLTRTVVSDAH